MSNHSPYEIYGKKNNTLKRYFMTPDVMHQLHQRFEVIRLDGSVEEDKRLAMTPESWTNKQFIGECNGIVENMYVGLSIYDTAEEKAAVYECLVDSIVQLCAKRSPTHELKMFITSVFENVNVGDLVRQTFKLLYVSLGKKRMGREMKDARKELIKLASQQTARFATASFDDLFKHVAEHPSSAFHLCSFYANEPHSIDFSHEEEDVFRKCLAVHNKNARPEDEAVYRSYVFEKVWEVVKQEEKKRADFKKMWEVAQEKEKKADHNDDDDNDDYDEEDEGGEEEEEENRARKRKRQM